MLTQAYALLMMAVFYGCYFFKMLRQRKQGIATDQLGKGKTGFVRFIEISLKVIAWLLPAAELISVFANTTSLPAWARLLGAVLCAAGITVFVLAVLEMRDSWRAGVPEGEDTDLVTTGVYAFSRNPAFLGFDLLYIGILLLFFNLPLLLLTLLAILLFHLQIVNVEEEFLLKTFGSDYLQYRKQVRRYLGRTHS